MKHFPDFATFCRAGRTASQLVPVYRRLLGDTLTPVSAFHKIDAGADGLLVRERRRRREGGPLQLSGRRSVLGDRSPRTTDVTVVSAGRHASEFDCDDPLEELRRRVEAIRRPRCPSCRRSPAAPWATPATTWCATASTCPTPRQTTASCPTWRSPSTTRWWSSTTSPRRTWWWRWPGSTSSARDLAGGLRRRPAARRRAGRAAANAPTATCRRPISAPRGEPCDRLPLELHPGRVRARPSSKCVEYIRAGDIFQVVISQRLEVPMHAHPFEIYRTLRVVNPSPFMFYLRTPSVTLVGSSPEIMVRVVDGRVTVRPLAGTRRRGATEEEDRRLAEELLADPKERAEHVMLVDLGRNDVGRVARYRSVELTDVMTIERYSHVMHITSNVTGQLAAGTRRLRRPAGLPAGRHRLRRAEGAGHGDHRRNRAAPPRALRRRGRLRRLHRQHGHLHRPADARRAGRQGLRPGRRRHRGRQRARRANTRKRSTRPAACSRRSRSPKRRLEGRK